AAAEALAALFCLLDAALDEAHVRDADGELVPVEVVLDDHGAVFERARGDHLGPRRRDEEVGEAPQVRFLRGCGFGFVLDRLLGRLAGGLLGGVFLGSGLARGLLGGGLAGGFRRLAGRAGRGGLLAATRAFLRRVGLAGPLLHVCFLSWSFNALASVSGRGWWALIASRPAGWHQDKHKKLRSLWVPPV